jgi:transposase IS481 family protein
VNVHKNAKMTALGRVLAVRRVVSGEPLGVVARGVGMSGRRLREWVRRWEAGDRTLADRSSRPQRMPRRLRRSQRRQIGRLRRQRQSSLRIAFALKLPLSTVVTEQRRQGFWPAYRASSRRRPSCGISASAPASWCTSTRRSLAGSAASAIASMGITPGG